MSLKIVVAHDFTCPWCWIGFSQAKRLKAEFGVEIDFRGYPLWPDELEWPEDGPPEVKNPDRPEVPSRFALALEVEGLPKITSKRPSKMRTTKAHMALEFARDSGCFETYLERLYNAYWLGGMNISEPENLVTLSMGLPMPVADLKTAIEAEKYRDRLVDFDDDAHAVGIYNVPTFIINGERFAEQPYSVLQSAVAKLVSQEPARSAYSGIAIPGPDENRPYIFLNMISTIDGKILSGERDEHVMDLGSKVDHATMRYLESFADGVMIGAGSLRATPGLWYDKRLSRYVVSGSGQVDRDSRFFTDAPEKAFIVGSEVAGMRCLPLDSWEGVLAVLRNEHGVQRLLIEGGSELNAQLLKLDLVDEIFLTMAPKIKLGHDVPTIAGGVPFSRTEITDWDLVRALPVGNEIFVRYRRRRS